MAADKRIEFQGVIYKRVHDVPYKRKKVYVPLNWEQDGPVCPNSKEVLEALDVEKITITYKAI